MSFPDDRLKKLKEDIADSRDPLKMREWGYCDHAEVFKALLARLEAAELVGAAAHAYINSISFITRDNYLQAEKTWREVAGK